MCVKFFAFFWGGGGGVGEGGGALHSEYMDIAHHCTYQERDQTCLFNILTSALSIRLKVGVLKNVCMIACFMYEIVSDFLCSLGHSRDFANSSSRMLGFVMFFKYLL